MYFIVGDIGNTSTRICLLNKKSKIIKSIILDTDKIFVKGFLKNKLKKLFKKNIRKKILFSSVVPLAFEKIKQLYKYEKFKFFEIKQFDLKQVN